MKDLTLIMGEFPNINYIELFIVLTIISIIAYILSTILWAYVLKNFLIFLRNLFRKKEDNNKNDKV
jgi:hypothetical protein